MVPGKSPAELPQALVAGGQGGLGDVGLSGTEQRGGVIEAEAAEMDGGTMAKLGGEKAAEVRRAGVGGGGDLGQADGLGETGRDKLEGGTDGGVEHQGRRWAVAGQRGWGRED